MLFSATSIIVFVVILGFVLFFVLIREKVAERRQPVIYNAKILVHLEKCKIIDSSYERESKPVSIINSLASATDSDLYSNDSYVNHIQVVYVRYDDRHNIYIGGPFSKSEVSIRLLFDRKKTTYIYIDKGNPGNYFFDLNFLKE